MNEYALRTVEDFFAVPPEKLADCLCDFAAWIGLCREYPSLLHRDHVVWKDDGLRGVTEVRIEVSHD